MIKHIVLLVSFFLFLACGSSKNNSTVLENAPEWVVKTPVNNFNYIGIGMASKASSDYREKAQKMALTEISNSISVTVSSNNSLNVFQYDDTFNEFYRMNSMVSSAAFLEGYDVVDVFENENYYYTYLSLSKQKHQELKRARINKALESSLFKFDYAKKLTLEKNFTEAIKQQIYALEDISEFLSEDLRYKENQIEKPYVSYLMNSIFTSLNQIEIQFPSKQLNIKHASDPKEIYIQPITVVSQNKPLSMIPVSVFYSWQPGQKLDLITESNGNITLIVPRNCSKNNLEKINILLDTYSLVKNISQNRVVQKIFENYQSKKFELTVTKKLPTVELDVFLIEKNRKNLNALEDELFQLLAADYFTLASKNAKKDFTITIENKKVENLQVNGKISTKLESRIKITNKSGHIIYQETIHNVIGIGSSTELAEQDALQSLMDKIKMVNYTAMVQTML
ncbi:LPP20 family lipoprotein [Flavobacterium sp. N2820]|uniref:LPP20 family lipoprotein n=1 Tax=Flavobacterium sp. N2820 TaxID=2986834 RepID=UPI002224D5EF|nr:LPP20 family lipoprotein [Flavobacterium sp. N2820]